jgi:sugar/nucleoside kinase (ribokinase family)
MNLDTLCSLIDLIMPGIGLLLATQSFQLFIQAPLSKPIDFSKPHDIISFTQCISDVIYQLPQNEIDNLLAQLDLKPEDAVVIDPQAYTLAKTFLDGKPYTIRPGGSAANTLAVYKSLGGGVATLAGVIGDDPYGEFFIQDLSQRTLQDCSLQKQGNSGHVIVLVSPQGERTMLVVPGVMNDFQALPEGCNLESPYICDHKILFIDAYSWAFGLNHLDFKQRIENIRNCGTLFAFSLGSDFIAENFRESILELLPSIDILFGNQTEMSLLFQLEGIPEIKQKLAQSTPLSVFTLGKEGAWVITPQEAHFVEAMGGAPLDTTGAGDAFAGGFLHGVLEGLRHDQASRRGAFASSEIIQIIGGRPEGCLADKFALRDGQASQ